MKVQVPCHGGFPFPSTALATIRSRNTGLKENRGSQVPRDEPRAPGKIFDFTAASFQIGDGQRRIPCGLACSMLILPAWI